MESSSREIEFGAESGALGSQIGGLVLVGKCKSVGIANRLTW
jgi:hypothetical protein